jgi:hypothetical protein
MTSFVVSPTLVVDARIGVIYHPFGLIYPGSTFDLASINMNGTGLPFQSFPGIFACDACTSPGGASGTSPGTTSPHAGLAAGNTGQVSEDTLGSTSVLVSKTFNKHSFRVGFDGNLTRYNVQNPQSGFGTFLFNRQFTQKNSVSTALAVMQAQGTLSPLCCWAILRADPTQTRWPMRFSNSTTASMCRMTGAS